MKYSNFLLQTVPCFLVILIRKVTHQTFHLVNMIEIHINDFSNEDMLYQACQWAYFQMPIRY